MFGTIAGGSERRRIVNPGAPRTSEAKGKAHWLDPRASGDRPRPVARGGDVGMECDDAITHAVADDVFAGYLFPYRIFFEGICTKSLCVLPLSLPLHIEDPLGICHWDKSEGFDTKFVLLHSFRERLMVSLTCWGKEGKMEHREKTKSVEWSVERGLRERICDAHWSQKPFIRSFNCPFVFAPLFFVLRGIKNGYNQVM